MLSPGLTVTESKGSYLTIDEWVKARFGAKNIQRMSLEVGQVEPAPSTLTAFGHKQRELLLLAATEVEAHWRWFLEHSGVTPSGQGFSTNDYVKLGQALFLQDFDVTIPRYPTISAFSPFLGWNTKRPTKSLPCYYAYNEIKHDRIGGLSRASLEMCLLAVSRKHRPVHREIWL